jgi:hypothetical protein
VTHPRPGDRLPAAPAPDPIRVLLVEDDEMLCIAIAGYLRTAGIEVTSAPDAETAAAAGKKVCAWTSSSPTCISRRTAAFGWPSGARDRAPAFPCS